MLVPSNFPELLANAGLLVYTMDGWEDIGAWADHKTICLHGTASSTIAKPQDDAAYCHHGSYIAPLYNILVDRTGVVWLISRNATNNSGRISFHAYNEAVSGRADLDSAYSRGLRDDVTNNRHIFAISAQNNGVNEVWSPELIRSMGIATLVSMDALGLAIGNVTLHKSLTRRKIDPSGPGCPPNWHEYLRDLAAELDAAPSYTPLPSTGDAMEIRTINTGDGYYIAASDGGVFAFGAARYFGSLGGQKLNAPIIGMALTPKDDGYWLASEDGGVFAFGTAQFFGSMGGQAMNEPIVSIETTPSGNGYWLLARDGGIFAFGDAQFLGAAVDYIN